MISEIWKTFYQFQEFLMNSLPNLNRRSMTVVHHRRNRAFHISHTSWHDAWWHRLTSATIHIDVQPTSSWPFRNDWNITRAVGSKWLESDVLRPNTSEVTLRKVYSWFTRFGFPVHIHTDGGPQFTSQNFKNKLAEWGVLPAVPSKLHTLQSRSFTR